MPRNDIEDSADSRAFPLEAFFHAEGPVFFTLECFFSVRQFRNDAPDALFCGDGFVSGVQGKIAVCRMADYPCQDGSSGGVRKIRELSFITGVVEEYGAWGEEYAVHVLGIAWESWAAAHDQDGAWKAESGQLIFDGSHCLDGFPDFGFPVRFMPVFTSIRQ